MPQQTRHRVKPPLPCGKKKIAFFVRISGECISLSSNSDTNQIQIPKSRCFHIGAFFCPKSPSSPPCPQLPSHRQPSSNPPFITLQTRPSNFAHPLTWIYEYCRKLFFK